MAFGEKFFFLCHKKHVPYSLINEERTVEKDKACLACSCLYEMDKRLKTFDNGEMESAMCGASSSNCEEKHGRLE